MEKKTIIGGLVMVMILIVGIWFFVDQRQPQTDSNKQSGINHQSGNFFPLETVRNIVVNTVNIVSDTIIETIDPKEELINNEEEVEALKQVVAQPVVSFGFINHQGTSTLFYVEQETGHILVIGTGTPIILSNTTIPKVQSVQISPNNPHRVFVGSINPAGELIYQQGIIDTKSTSTELVLKPITGPIAKLILSPDSKQVFTLKTGLDGAVGQISNTNSNLATTIFSSPFSEWLVEWVNNQNLSLTSKPSAGIIGSTYLFNIKSRVLQPKLVDYSGLSSVLSEDGENILLSTTSNSEIETIIRVKNDILQAPFKTLADKCVWSGIMNGFICAVPKDIINTVYPDNWYKGLISFDDQFWIFNIKDNVAYLIYNQDKLKIDVINLIISINKPIVYFQNKADWSLWQLDLDAAFKR